MAKKWPGMVVNRSFIKEHSFVYRLYMDAALDLNSNLDPTKES